MAKVLTLFIALSTAPATWPACYCALGHDTWEQFWGVHSARGEVPPMAWWQFQQEEGAQR